MLLCPETLELHPVAAQVLARLPHEGRFKGELPASQVELVTAPHPTVTEAVAELTGLRRGLALACEGLARPAALAVHPFSAARGALSAGERYQAIAAEYGSVAERQLVASLQVHIAVGGAARTLGVYNALRLLLPELAALAASAPFYEGLDTGLASVRPSICVQLPRQGIPPYLEDWGQLVDELRWGAAGRRGIDRSSWWWELRPHLANGTLELRVPDVQATIADAAAIAGFVQALTVELAERFDGGERALEIPIWRLQENRWSAQRHGIEGWLADLVDGTPQPTRARLSDLVEQVRPAAEHLGTGALLDHLVALIEENGAVRQRRLHARDGMRGLVEWHARAFLTGSGVAAGG